MMKIYEYLIFDVDDTLLSFRSAFDLNQKRTAALLGVECSEDFRQLYDLCGWRAWREQGLDEGGAYYHRCYDRYVRSLFVYLLEKLKIDFDIEALVRTYFTSLASSTELMEPCAVEVFRALSGKYKMALATNGITDVQKKRVAAFLPYMSRMFISEEMGVAKPMNEYFSHILRELDCPAEKCLMTGDSISNDIAGAKKVGMDVCFYNPKNKPLPENTKCEYVISSLKELTDILL